MKPTSPRFEGRIFNEETLRRLESLRIAVRRAVRAFREGERASRRRGGAVEFVSHRAYVPGDDVRSIDWNLYARWGCLFVQDRAREEVLTVHLVLDASASMDLGVPPKYLHACRVAAGVAAAAFAEPARATLWTAEGARSYDSLPALLRGLEETESPRKDPAAALRRLAVESRSRGMVLFLSDLWEEEMRHPLVGTRESGDVTVLHVLSPEEAAPSERGRVRFVDVETGETLERFISPPQALRYSELLEEHTERWRNWCGERGLRYVRTLSNENWEGVVARALRRAGPPERPTTSLGRAGPPERPTTSFGRAGPPERPNASFGRAGISE